MDLRDLILKDNNKSNQYHNDQNDLDRSHPPVIMTKSLIIFLFIGIPYFHAAVVCDIGVGMCGGRALLCGWG